MSKIITASDLNSYTGKTLDAGRAQVIVDAVNAYIENRTGRCWGEVKTVTDEVHDIRSTTYLRKMDVTGVTTVKYGRGTGQVTAPADNYVWNASGRVNAYLPIAYTASSPRAYIDGLTVTYTYGVMEVPDDLKLAALSLAADSYNHAASEQKDVKSTSVGSYSVTYATGEATSSGARYMSVIDSYRMRRA